MMLVLIQVGFLLWTFTCQRGFVQAACLSSTDCALDQDCINSVCTNPCTLIPNRPDCMCVTITHMARCISLCPPDHTLNKNGICVQTGATRIEDYVNHFLVGRSTYVETYNSSDMTKPQIVLGPNIGKALRVDYHYAKNLMFSYINKGLYRSSLAPTGTPQQATFVIEMGDCLGFTVDWVSDSIFWAGCSDQDASINVVDLEGVSSTTVKRWTNTYSINYLAVDPYYGKLFWIRNNRIESCELDGQDFRTNMTAYDLQLRGLTIDVHTQRLFYIGVKHSEAVLFSFNYKGEAMKTHFNIPKFGILYGLSVYKGYIYWDTCHETDTLYKASLKTSRIKTVNHFNATDVWDLKLVNSQLQTKPCSLSGGLGDCDEKVDKDFYLDNTKKLSWHDAYMHCRSKGLRLATIMTEKENEAMLEQVHKIYPGPTYPSIWLGGWNRGKPDTWTWFDTGSKINYTDWRPGQPDPITVGSRDECLSLSSTTSFSLKWNYEKCDNELPFVCEHLEQSFN